MDGINSSTTVYVMTFIVLGFSSFSICSFGAGANLATVLLQFIDVRFCPMYEAL